MKEYEQLLDEELLGTGLVRDSGQLGLEECFNLVPTKSGLRKQTLPRLDLTDTEWPFPQKFAIGDLIISATNTTLGDMPVSAQHWTGITWSEFGVFSNGLESLYVDSGGAISVLDPGVVPAFAAGLNYKGQLICGKGNVLTWSHFDSIDCRIDLSNEAGQLQLDGRVIGLEQLGDFIITATTFGLCQLQVGNFPGFGIARQWNIPVTALGGNGTECLVLDTIGILWVLRESGLERLGFSAYMNRLDLDIVQIFWSHLTSTFHITDGKTTFSFYENRLFENWIVPTSIFSVHGEEHLVTRETCPNSFHWTTTPLDAGRRSQKFIRSVEFNGDILGLKEGILCYQYRTDEGFRRAARKMGPEGTFHPNASAARFKVGAGGKFTGPEFTLNSALLKYKLGDKRNIRGLMTNA